jgi:cell wall-associated NlpC family hydrolase
MKCNTYTDTDRINLESKLKLAIEEAGYGTRAGVVEAARFLVGALDYKVPYLGPKKDDSSLGRYSKIGLNIGKKGAWGCLVSGWIQGMDCTNFVSWAFYQNGISMHPYSNNHFNIREVIDQIKVGDLLYSPCVSTCKNDYKLSHVGIIIGIDDNYFYVAESTTGNINAIIVSKLDKRNLPEKDKFSRVNLYQYSSEGNVTNMWVQ